MSEIQIARFSDWFQIVKTEDDLFQLSFKVLIKLKNRKSKGLNYNRMNIISEIAFDKSSESITTLDESFLFLKSKELIRFEKVSGLSFKIYITPKGLNHLNKLEEKLNEIRKN